jgi:hypothetical protein
VITLVIVDHRWQIICFIICYFSFFSLLYIFFSFQVEETFERALGGVAEENVQLEINSLRRAMFFL